MARANYVKKALKDNPAVEKGQPYWWWQFRHGPKRYSATRPRQSQLTNSDKLSRSYAASEALEDLCKNAEQHGAPDEFASLVREQAEAIREVAEEYNESADNMEQSFSGGSPTIDDCREKAEGLEAWADEVEAAADQIDGLDEDDSDWWDQAVGEVEAVMGNCPV